MDWTLVDSNADLLRFWREMIALRKRHPVLQRRRFFTGETNDRGIPDIAWHGCALGQPGWNDPTSRVLSFTMGGFGEETDIHVILNMADSDLAFELPRLEGRTWMRAVDTGLDSPADIAGPGQEQPVDGTSYQAPSRSVAVFTSK
jgi:glycogen operon protein